MYNTHSGRYLQAKIKLRPFVMTALALAVSNVWAETVTENAAPEVLAVTQTAETPAANSASEKAEVNPVSKVVEASPAAATATVIPAQEKVADAVLETVVVTGKALSVQKSIAEKRYQSVISDGVSADEVGSIPDFGLGEAIQRIPGVSMLQNNNRGEAQFMTIRGFNPDYSTTLVDGIALPATETTRRIVSLDILPSSLPRQVTVFKTNTPDMESNAIAGTVNLRTRSAFDSNGMFASLRADYADWENERKVLGKDKPSGQVEGVFSNTFGPDDQFGFVLSGNYYRRESSSLDTASTSVNYYAPNASPTTSAAFTNSTAATTANNLANTDLSNYTAVPTARRWLEYDNIRERQGLFGKLEFDNHENLQAHATAGYFQHTNNEFRWAQQESLTGTITRNSDTTGSSSTGSATSDVSHFVQTREVKYLDLGGSFMPSETQKLDAGFNVAEGSYRQDNTTIAATQASSTALATSYLAQPGSVAYFTPASNSAYQNSANYILNSTNGIYFQPEQSSTLTKQYKLDFSSNMEDGNLGLGYKTGMLLKNSDVNYDLDQTGYNSSGISLATTGIASQSFEPYNGNGQTMLMLSPSGALNYLSANPSLFTLNPTNLRVSTVSDFSINERSKAAYVLGSFRDEKWNVIVGGRYENMGRDITNKETINPSISGTASDSLANYRDVTVSGSEHFFLPSINASYDITPSLKLRGAATQTLGMPSYSQLAQNGAVAFASTSASDIATADGGTAAVGRLGTVSSPITVANPYLKTREANNFDISTEWYLSSNSLLSMALFRKDIKNEIVTVTNTTTNVAAPYGLLGTYDITTSQAVQTNDSQVLGIELSAAKTSFDFLPFPFNLFGATANMTMLDMSPSSIRMNDGTMRKLPQLLESPKKVANASLLFNYDKISAQVSCIYTGIMPRSFNANNSANDVWYAPTTMLDIQVRYKLDKRTNIVFQGKNLTNETQDRLWGPSQNLVAESFQNGRSFYLGLSYVF